MAAEILPTPVAYFPLSLGVVQWPPIGAWDGVSRQVSLAPQLLAAVSYRLLDKVQDLKDHTCDRFSLSRSPQQRPLPSLE